jgi:pimeloyl-ACP methyl ester carboxylesterase
VNRDRQLNGQETHIRTGTLTASGTPIDYRERGDGPPLLVLPGGVGHAGLADGLAAHLADEYRVVAVSSRLASARPGTEVGDQDPAGHAADAPAVVDALFDEPPVVFGFSAGAIVALELVARHPDRVRLAVVHEPPVFGLLPDAARHRDAVEAVRATARTEGVAAAGRLMATVMTAAAPDPTPADPAPDAAADAAARAEGPAAPAEDRVAGAVRQVGGWVDGYAASRPEPPSPELRELLARLGGVQARFLEHVLVPFTTGAVDLAALGAVAARLVPVAGIDSRGQLPYRAAAALAGGLGLPLTEVPGGHLGPVQRPAQFAGALRSLVDDVTRNTAG